MHFRFVMLAFPIILALHNAEEYRRSREFVAIFHHRLPERFTERRVLLASMAVLTCASVLLAVLTAWQPTPALLWLSRIACFALLANAIGHGAFSARSRAVAPGSITAVVLVLPFSLDAIFRMHFGLGDSLRIMAWNGLLGTASMPLLGFAALLAGYGITLVATVFEARLTSDRKPSTARNVS